MNQGSNYTSPYEGYEAASSSTSTSGGNGNLMYLVAGGLIGAAAALLLAPKAGSELRGDVADAARRGYDGALDLGTRVKEQGTDLYGTLRDKAAPLVEAAANKLGAGQGDTTSGLNADGIASKAEDLLSLGSESNSTSTNH